VNFTGIQFSTDKLESTKLDENIFELDAPIFEV